MATSTEYRRFTTEDTESTESTESTEEENKLLDVSRSEVTQPFVSFVNFVFSVVITAALLPYEVRMNSQRLTKVFLRVFIASIVATALVGIVAISGVTNNWDVELKIFLTTAIIAGASICGLACGGCLTRGHRMLPGAGLVLTGLAAVLLLLGMWVEI